jgi:hypothetical protein
MEEVEGEATARPGRRAVANFMLESFTGRGVVLGRGVVCLFGCVAAVSFFSRMDIQKFP